ncbi:MAG: GMC family oxidoreductase N-terminal domain-containing protein [Chloroflexi bacterium]|nr:GMC family oxidoreductase N-terminal domain-containing protein [Chloroflexota bacterium]
MKYDHIIVGAGSAGSILANRLSEDPNRSVLLLEAGTDFPDLQQLPGELKYLYGDRPDVYESEHLWNYEARATDEALPILVPRGKVIGGSSAVNGAQFLRGVREDYDLWAEWGNDEWSFEKILPYFKKNENDSDFQDEYHGTDGPIHCRRFTPDEWGPQQQAFYDACLHAGFPDCPDHNRPDSTGVGPLTFNIVDRVRWNTALGYLDPARHRMNLTIKPNCLVHGVIFDGNRATGLLLVSGGEMFTVYGEEVILSAGAIGTPHILGLSGVGPGDQLAQLGISVVQDLPGLGRNLRDHTSIDINWSSKQVFPLKEERVAAGAITLRYTASGSPYKNDMIVYMNNRLAEAPGRSLDESKDAGISVYLCMYLALSSGELRIQSTDPSQPPALDYNYLQDPLDRSRYREGIRLCVDLFKQAEFNDLVEERLAPSDDILASDEALDLWVKQQVRTAHHICGTAKMGPSSDPLAVVDQYGKVYGVEGLRVVDASIMPHCVRANLNATIMAMAERIADFIKEGR